MQYIEPMKTEGRKQSIKQELKLKTRSFQTRTYKEKKKIYFNTTAPHLSIDALLTKQLPTNQCPARDISSHHLLTDAQPVPEQWLPPGQLLPVLCLCMMLYAIQYGTSLCPVFAGSVPSQLLVHPKPPHWQGSMKS